MAIGLLDKIIEGGILILPSRDMYQYLTDRIGNFAEIEPYFPVWKNLCISNGVLAVIEIEHDDLLLKMSLPLEKAQMAGHSNKSEQDIMVQFKSFADIIQQGMYHNLVP